MKKLAIVIVLALVVAVMAPVMANEMAKKNTHEMTAWFVSADAKTNMMTIKDEKGEEKTVPVMAAAVKEMSSLKAGQKMMLTCMDDEKGMHQGVSAIKTETAKK